MPDLRPPIAELLRGGALAGAPPIARSNQGEIRRLRVAGRDFAVKRAVGRGPVALANRWALAREARAYARLAGVPGLPACHGLIDGRWLVLDWVEARPFRQSQVDAAFFDHLLATLQAMHARGVAHADLKRKSNLLVAEDGAPVLVDFGAALLRRDGFHPLNQRLFEFLRQTDLNAWVKLKHGGYDNVPEPDLSLLRRSPLERALGALRRR